MQFRPITLAVCAAPLLWLMACGGGSGAGSNQAPAAVISSPGLGTTFRAGDTLTVSVSATDPEDGAVPPSNLTWWAELHHDTHTHPFQPPVDSAGGSVRIPTRGETSDNIFYRFHLRATDSVGLSTEVTRDVLPQKARITLATQPAGLALRLDGQPVAGSHTVTGVVGMERDVEAFDQNFGGRRYRFDRWSDSGAASHTIVTPAADATFTASFTDVGPAAAQPPTVSLAAVTGGTVGEPMTLTAQASDNGSVVRVEFFDGSALIGSDTTSFYSLSWTPTIAGVRNLTARATDNEGVQTTSAAISVTISGAAGDGQAPLATLTSPAHLASGLTGMLTLSATASDNVAVAGVEFQIDGATVGGEDTSAPYQVTVDSSIYASGQHVVRARARDAAGNRSPWSSATVRLGGNRALPQGFALDASWAPAGVTLATSFAATPDGRILVAEQAGALRVIKNGVLLPAPFVQLAVDLNGERGLIGVTVHPNFAANGYVYVHYTTPDGTHNRISRFVANGDVAGAEQVLVDLPPLGSATNHNGGALAFGGDGRLYVGVGDNGNPANAQNLGTVFGKLLRFNDDGSIPTDNPFYTSQSGLARAVWSYGLRNPFTFAFQPGTGRLHVNDVGEASWEEVNLSAAGANHGWPQSEGPDNASGAIAGPLFAYPHASTTPPGAGPGGFFAGVAITGGAFYPNAGPFPAAYRGQYYFADWIGGFIARMDLANDSQVYTFANLDFALGLLVMPDGSLMVLRQWTVSRISAQ
jgi:glucose/arabinose dehydrogenase